MCYVKQTLMINMNSYICGLNMYQHLYVVEMLGKYHDSYERKITTKKQK